MNKPTMYSKGQTVYLAICDENGEYKNEYGSRITIRPAVITCARINRKTKSEEYILQNWVSPWASNEIEPTKEEVIQKYELTPAS